ncbi:hypothetical protein NMY22_g15280 [Coprinellus aureogranulatus]|nr:hypothetical protein NMY22_g15280 [Coprinellus aureogranulatus]
MASTAFRLASKRASLAGFARSSGRRSIHMTAPRAALYAQADEKTFKEVTGAKDRVVLVDFYADWCGPCHQLSPVIESLTAEPNKSGSGLPLDLIKVNTDTEEGAPLAQAFKSILVTFHSSEHSSFHSHLRLPLPGMIRAILGITHGWALTSLRELWSAVLLHDVLEELGESELFAVEASSERTAADRRMCGTYTRNVVRERLNLIWDL